MQFRYLLVQFRDLNILLLFNSVDNIFFHLVKARPELTEAFIKQASHTCKQISDLLRHCCTDRLIELHFRRPDCLFQVQLVQVVLGYEAALEF